MLCKLVKVRIRKEVDSSPKSSGSKIHRENEVVKERLSNAKKRDEPHMTKP